ncbi:ribonuclease H-like domain-containing protein [Leptodontidium sp. MPI-SDFR-AT-0119]|nr:ribonuclease H-like domain-containing protein [Leptodontidium sp. MPI-SDFR-AT-0119]
MSLPQPPKQLVHTLPNGKTVCFDHHLRRCDFCTVDFSFESDEDDEDELGYYGSDGSDALDDRYDFEDEEEENEDRVFILGGSAARFTPQWDEQVLGPANISQIRQDDENPPKPLPLSSLSTHYCTTCQLTWLVGEKGEEAAKSHPSHHSYSHIYAGTSRSLLVFTDGACSGNGAPGARVGMGVFFGPGSKFNLAERLTISGNPTSQKAELEAVASAMETIRTTILPDRRGIVLGSKGGHNPRAVFDVMHMRLIIVTDSSYIVEGMCKHMSNWKKNTQGVLVNKDGKLVENSQAFLRLQSEVEKLSMVGVQVAYYHVGRQENKEADGLAKASIMGDVLGRQDRFPATGFSESFHYNVN